MVKRQRTAGGYRSDTGVRGRYGAKNAFEAWAGRKYPSGQYVRQYHPRNTETLASFGASRSVATPGQLAARDQHRVVGRGVYSIDGMARSGVDYGVDFARRAMKPVSRKLMSGQAKPVKQLYYGVGRALSGPAAKKAIAKVASATAQGYMAGGAGIASKAAGAATGSLISEAMKRRRVGGRGMYSPFGAGSSAPMRNKSDKMNYGQLFTPKVAAFSNSSHDFGGCVYENQEFFQYVYAPELKDGVVPFTSLSVDVQPGTLTPMLSQLSKNFKFYQFHGCVFHFESMLDGGALQSETGQVGSILMHAFTDSLASDFRSASEFEKQDDNHTAKITEGLACGVECDPAMLAGLDQSGYNKVRWNAVDSSSKNDYDQGRVQIALSGINPNLAGRVIGKIKVSYKVELIKNEVVVAAGRGTDADRFSRSDSDITPTANARLTMFGQGLDRRSMIAHPYNNLGVTFVTKVAGDASDSDIVELTFPKNLEGLFKVACSINITDAESVMGIETSLGNLLIGGRTKTNYMDAFGGAGLLTRGNVEVVPTLGTPHEITSAEIASDGATAFGNLGRTNKAGYVVTQTYDDMADGAVMVRSGSANTLTVGGATLTSTPYMVDCVNSFVMTSTFGDAQAGGTSSNQTSEPKYVTMGRLEVYIRLRAATDGRANKICLVSGLDNYITSSGAPPDLVDWSIERADDHGHYDSVYAGVSL